MTLEGPSLPCLVDSQRQWRSGPCGHHLYYQFRAHAPPLLPHDPFGLWVNTLCPNHFWSSGARQLRMALTSCLLRSFKLVSQTTLPHWILPLETTGFLCPLPSLNTETGTKGRQVQWLTERRDFPPTKFTILQYKIKNKHCNGCFVTNKLTESWKLMEKCISPFPTCLNKMLDLVTMFTKLSWYFYWKWTDHKYEGVSILSIYVYPYTSIIKVFSKKLQKYCSFPLALLRYNWQIKL